ncbi:hypothetical protein BRADI_4g41332v3 [Brachypodium distachyon]|uniref:Uncharacterized protein n=1 Tax=Brachypodium distachyon TaxID=15368 RepID=A0A2K2CTL7_BRADI|nr:hypothetical protein BRADI_4g41332v3 [Brachypodium distachyon]
MMATLLPACSPAAKTKFMFIRNACVSFPALTPGPAVSGSSMTVTVPKKVLEVLVVAARATCTAVGLGPLKFYVCLFLYLGWRGWAGGDEEEEDGGEERGGGGEEEQEDGGEEHGGGGGGHWWLAGFAL